MPHFEPNMPVGERIAVWRLHRGMTQETCAGLIGKSLSWWKKVEQGVRHVEKLSDLILIAQVLRIRDLADLTGVRDFSLPLDKRDHPALPGVRAAVMSYGLVPSDAEAVPNLDELAERNQRMWRIWHTSPHFYTRAGELLPALVTDAATAHRAATGIDRRTAAGVLAQSYHLARQWLRKVCEYDLAWIAADRAMAAAQESDDPYLIGMSAWNLASLYNAVGKSEDAQAITADGIALLDPMISGGPERYLSMWGALQLFRAIAFARCGDTGNSWRAWDAGDEVARRLGPDHIHPWTIFGQANVGAYAVAIPVELGRAGEAVRAAERLDPATLPSVERRSRYLIDVARGYVGKRDDVACLHILLRAEKESPEEVAHSVLVHEIVREMLRRDRRTITGDLRGLATRIGLVPG